MAINTRGNFRAGVVADPRERRMEMVQQALQGGRVSLPENQTAQSAAQRKGNTQGSLNKIGKIDDVTGGNLRNFLGDTTGVGDPALAQVFGPRVASVPSADAISAFEGASPGLTSQLSAANTVNAAGAGGQALTAPLGAAEAANIAGISAGAGAGAAGAAGGAAGAAGGAGGAAAGGAASSAAKSGGAAAGEGVMALLALLCWVAREVYGEENPQWMEFRDWLVTEAPPELVDAYVRHGSEFADWISDKPLMKRAVKRLMDEAIGAEGNNGPE